MSTASGRELGGGCGFLGFECLRGMWLWGQTVRVISGSNFVICSGSQKLISSVVFGFAARVFKFDVAYRLFIIIPAYS